MSGLMKAGLGVAAAVITLTLGAWPPEDHKPMGGDVIPVRSLVDPYPEFNGLAIDAEHNVVFATDSNRKTVLVYSRAGSEKKSTATTEPLQQIIGPETNIGFVAGAVVDPLHRELIAVNNDIEDTVMVWPYGTKGNVRPVRLLSVPHQAWGLALSTSRNELAVSVEIQNAIVIYRREADKLEPPVRFIRGPQTGMADPHGVSWDETHNEIAVANHGNFRGLLKNMGLGCVRNPHPEETDEAGQLQAPSITFYTATAEGDVKPLRTIQGAQTQLDWPMGVAVDAVHNEVAVANNGDNSILVFSRTGSGDSAPLRVISGDRTGINHPMAVVVDAKNDEIWAANFGDHTAVAFARSANGNVAPKRIIRNAPAGTPTVGFGNPMAVSYDTKRGEILVPN